MLIGFLIWVPNLDHDFGIPLRPIEQNSPLVLAEAILRHHEQYNTALDIFNGNTRIKVYAVWPLNEQQALANAAPLDGSCSAQEGDNNALHLQVTPRCQSMVKVYNPEDRFCLTRAVLIGLKYREFMPHRETDYKTYCKFSIIKEIIYIIKLMFKVLTSCSMEKTLVT